MAQNIFSRISRFFNNLVDVVTQGSFQRTRLIQEFNGMFLEAYREGGTDRLCTVSTCYGNPDFRHEMSAVHFRSGFRISIENDDNLSKEDLMESASYVIEQISLIKQLMALGYDTLIVKGKNRLTGVQIPLKEIANLHHYLLNGGQL